MFLKQHSTKAESSASSKISRRCWRACFSRSSKRFFEIAGNPLSLEFTSESSKNGTLLDMSSTAIVAVCSARSKVCTSTRRYMLDRVPRHMRLNQRMIFMGNPSMTRADVRATITLSELGNHWIVLPRAARKSKPRSNTTPSPLISGMRNSALSWTYVKERTQIGRPYEEPIRSAGAEISPSLLKHSTANLISMPSRKASQGKPSEASAP
mmetsp:Transcript_96596/g.191460  ORF Transcript_96596/g.191460 Transcript_96596/m.191460 type:complete len:210 (-) Transcript_96596:456-1085(-)